MHIPVLQKEVLKYLDPKPNENFIDCTIDGGGHSLSILEKIAPQGKLLGIDADSEIIKNLKATLWGVRFASRKIKNFEKRIILVTDNFANLKEIVKDTKFEQAAGILFDLGMSSWHLEESGRGFSFLKDEPLIMRYNWNSARSILLHSNELFDELTAERIVNQWSASEIEKILREYGEERFAKRIAKEIVEARKIKPIKNTFQLTEIIKKAVPPKTKIHPATRTFQALRIAVNDELNNLEKVLPQTIDVLKSGGRIVIISFHSLEDRIVKNFLKENKDKGLLRPLTKKPIMAQKEEIKINPRCRSAKLRAALKL